MKNLRNSVFLAATLIASVAQPMKRNIKTQEILDETSGHVWLLPEDSYTNGLDSHPTKKYKEIDTSSDFDFFGQDQQANNQFYDQDVFTTSNSESPSNQYFSDGIEEIFSTSNSNVNSNQNSSDEIEEGVAQDDFEQVDIEQIVMNTSIDYLLNSPIKFNKNNNSSNANAEYIDIETLLQQAMENIPAIESLPVVAANKKTQVKISMHFSDTDISDFSESISISDIEDEKEISINQKQKNEQTLAREEEESSDLEAFFQKLSDDDLTVNQAQYTNEQYAFEISSVELESNNNQEREKIAIQKPYPCSNCDRTFGRPCDLSKHAKACKKNSEKSKNITPSQQNAGNDDSQEGRHECPHCYRNFTRESSLTGHMQTCKENPEYQTNNFKK